MGGECDSVGSDGGGVLYCRVRMVKMAGVLGVVKMAGDVEGCEDGRAC